MARQARELVTDYSEHPEEHEDVDDDVQDSHPQSLTEKRHVQKKIFDEWLLNEAVEQADIPGPKGKECSNKSDECLSMNALMEQASGHIVNHPREYQIELFERAKEENTIAVLDTGSGKTLIAVLLLRWTIDQELERRAAGQQAKVSFFLVASTALVFQQFAVLRSNLDHEVSHFVGAMRCERWGKDEWQKQYTDNRVIVCTADILQHCLRHGFITMRRINLLIFDEAHHTKKNHAYARIIKDYYLAEHQESARPRIFGMTASPVDAKTDVVQAAYELESLLHARIATTVNMSTVEHYAARPKERMLQYNPPRPPKDTALVIELRNRFDHITIIKDCLVKAEDVALNLGPWCASEYLFNAISENRLPRYEMYIEREFHRRKEQQTMKALNQTIHDLREAALIVKAMRDKAETRFEPGDLTSKVQLLRRWLEEEFGKQIADSNEPRCIVFVEKRRTARLLHAAFKRLGNAILKTAFLVGTDATGREEDNLSHREQMLVLARFRRGDINCVFATSVAEEGLDVPSCNLVVRFDMYRTMIQYVQSRGRARQRNAIFCHMIEKDNGLHRQMQYEVRQQECAMRRFCEQMPNDRILLCNEDVRGALLAKEAGLRSFTVQSTGAKLSYSNALDYLTNFVSAIPNDHSEPLHPIYLVSHRGQKFLAEVILPGTAPIRSAVGRLCNKKILARCSAAFEACLELYKKRYLDEHLVPTYQKKLPAMRNALLAKNLHITNAYSMRTKPDIWAHSRGTLPAELFVTIIDFTQGLERAHQPIALLTRTRLPQFPKFSIYLMDGSESTVQPTALDQSLATTDRILEKLSIWTWRVFRDVFSKTYEQDATQLSYWLAPANEVSRNTVASDAIDWEAVDAACTEDEIRWDPQMPDHLLVNKFWYDYWDGSRKFFSLSISNTLKPQDPVPADCARHKWMANILDYSNSMFKNSRAKITWTEEQPVVEVEKVRPRRNMLAPPSTQEMAVRKRAVICPEPLRISALSIKLATTCFTFPAVIHRFESYLIALEACDLVGITCAPEVALAAVTKDSDNSGEHEEQERVNFQHGMGTNYERLEFIGDCFLKMATTISTFVQNPNDDQFDFHVKRMLLLCNENLYQVAKKLKLYEYIRSQAFSRRAWYPEGLNLLFGKGAGSKGNEPAQHSLGQKTIADVSEALIGAAFVMHNKPGDWSPEHWTDAVKAVTKLVDSNDHGMMRWADYRAAYTKPAYQVGEATASQKDLAEKVEAEHPYRFTYPKLLRSAFIHPSLGSMLFERVPHYERLEFLGDALLDMASITYLFYRFPDKDPQWLTEHKMAMVSNKFLGCVCVKIGFHKHLRFASHSLPAQIQQYEEELLDAERLAGDARDYWTRVSDPPKCLPDIVESFIGAMFIDSDFDYGQVQRFFDQHIQPFFEVMSVYDTFANNHPCTHLYTLLQTTHGCRDFRVMAQEVPSQGSLEKVDVVAAVMIHSRVIAHSKGKSGRYARLRAAQNALDMVKELAPCDFRAKFGCDCAIADVGSDEKDESIARAADCGV